MRARVWLRKDEGRTTTGVRDARCGRAQNSNRQNCWEAYKNDDKLCACTADVAIDVIDDVAGVCVVAAAAAVNRTDMFGNRVRV